MDARSKAIQEGIEHAYQGTPDEAKEAAWNAIVRYAQANEFFDGGDILRWWRTTNDPIAHQDWRNRWGGMIGAARGAGIIEKTGYQEPKSVQSHTKELVRWRSLIYTGTTNVRRLGMNVDDATKIYLSLRDEKDRIEAEAKKAKRAITEKMEVIEQWFLLKGDNEGVESWKTPFGTPYFAEASNASVGDWDEVLDYVKNNDAYEILTHGVNKSAIREFLEKNDELPPGVNYTTVRKLYVRKPTKKGDN
jgi:hypothetical protein